MHKKTNTFSVIDKISRILQKIIQNKTSSEDDLRIFISLLLMNKDIPNVDSFLSAFLTGLSFTDLSSRKISFIVDEILKVDNYKPYNKELSDIKNIVCVAGSGKKYHKTLNITTMSAILASGLGAKIIKPTSKGVTSKLGSEELLTHLNIPIHTDIYNIHNQLKKFNISFTSIENNIPTFDDIYGGRQLTISPLSNILPGLMSPIKCEHMYYGLSSDQHSKSLKLFRQYGISGNISVVCSEYREGFIDELLFVNKSKLSMLRDDNLIEEYKILDILPEKIDPQNIESLSDENKNITYILRSVNSGLVNDYTKTISLNSAGILVTSNIYSTFEEAYRDSLDYITSLKLSNRLKKIQNL